MKDNNIERIEVKGTPPTEMDACRSALVWSLIGDVLSNWRDNGPISCEEETLIDADYVDAVGGEEGLKAVQDAVSNELLRILADVKMLDAEEVRSDTLVLAKVRVDYLEDDGGQALFSMSVERVEN